jgi:hypothetical protein
MTNYKTYILIANTLDDLAKRLEKSAAIEKAFLEKFDQETQDFFKQEGNESKEGAVFARRLATQYFGEAYEINRKKYSLNRDAT